MVDAKTAPMTKSAPDRSARTKVVWKGAATTKAAATIKSATPARTSVLSALKVHIVPAARFVEKTPASRVPLIANAPKANCVCKESAVTETADSTQTAKTEKYAKATSATPVHKTQTAPLEASAKLESVRWAAAPMRDVSRVRFVITPPKPAKVVSKTTTAKADRSAKTAPVRNVRTTKIVTAALCVSTISAFPMRVEKTLNARLAKFVETTSAMCVLSTKSVRQPNSA